MKTTILAVAAATLLAVSAGATAARSYRNVDSLVAHGADGGKIIVTVSYAITTFRRTTTDLTVA